MFSVVLSYSETSFRQLNLEEVYSNDDNGEHLLYTYPVPALLIFLTLKLSLLLSQLTTEEAEALRCPLTCLKLCSSVHIGPNLLTTFTLSLYKPFHFGLYVLQKPFEKGRLSPFFLQGGREVVCEKLMGHHYEFNLD